MGTPKKTNNNPPQKIILEASMGISAKKQMFNENTEAKEKEGQFVLLL